LSRRKNDVWWLLLLLLAFRKAGASSPASSPGVPTGNPMGDPDGTDPDRYPTPEEIEEWVKHGTIHHQR
jgi:hypothetical protein